MDKKIQKSIRSAILAALIFLCTYLLKIPTSNGYVHLGDGLILFTAALTPLSCSVPAAVIGAALADLLSGYAVYIPATVVVKGLMALIMGLFSYKKGFVAAGTGAKSTAKTVITAAAGAVIAGTADVGGYFAAELIMYGVGGAAANIIPNALQAVSGIVLFFVLAPIAGKLKIKM